MKNLSLSFLIILTLVPFSMKSIGQDTPVDETTIEPTVYGPMDLWGVGVKAGLDGVGFEVVKGFGERLNLRLGYSTLNIPYTLEQTVEGFNLLAEANIKLGGGSFLVDFYPVKNFVHLTAGVLQNGTRITVAASSLSGFPYGDLTIPAENVGSITAELTLGMPFSPYVGLGFGNTLSRKHRVSFNFELGALYHGGPKLVLTGDGIIGPMASEHNQTLINDAIKQYSWFPALNLQLTFRII